MKQTLLFLLFFSFFNTTLFSQIQKTDSLRAQLPHTEGKNKLQTLRKLYWAFTLTNSDSTFRYLDLFEKEAIKQKDSVSQCQAIVSKVEMYYNSQQADTLIAYAEKRIPFLRQCKSYLFQFGVEYYVVLSLSRQGRSSEALSRAKKAYEEAKTINAPAPMVYSCMALGELYVAIKQPEDAHYFYKEGLKHILKFPDKHGVIMDFYTQIILMELDFKKYDEALEHAIDFLKYIDQCEINFAKADRKSDMEQFIVLYKVQCFCFLAEAYMSLDDYETAKKYINRIDLYAGSDWTPMFQIQHNKVKYLYYKGTKDYSKALYCLNLIIEDYKPGDHQIALLDILKFKAEILFLLKNYKESAELYKQVMEKNDSLTSAEYTKEVSMLKIRYETVEKEKQLLAQKVEIQKMRFILIGSIAGFVIVLFILFLLIRNARKTRQKNQSLLAQISALSDKETKLGQLRKTIAEAVEPNEDLALFSRLEQQLLAEKDYLNPNLTREEMARILYTNDLYLRNAIKNVSGMSFGVYLNTLRLEHARKIIAQENKKNISITDVAFASGFNSVRTFNRLFKETYGLTPGEVKNTMLVPLQLVEEVA